VIDAAGAQRRLLWLTALRWLPVGVTFGLTALLPLERGLSLVEVGAILSVQGIVALVLELPTGGLADALGRRPVLLIAALIGLASTVLFVLAQDVAAFAVAMLLQGVFRTLDSGPLEAWYVDTAHADDPAAPVEQGLARAATVLGVSIAAGALGGGLLVAWAPIPGTSALVLPFLVSLTLSAVGLVVTAILVVEPARARRRADGAAASSSGLRGALRLFRRSPILRALLAVEVFWAVAMVAFETLTPVRLAELAGGEDAAGALFGPASAAAWGLFALGSLMAGRASRRWGVAVTAALARILNGAFVVVMGVVAGPVGLLAAYGAAYLSHGAAGPMHNTLLHRQADAGTRASVLSANAMVSGGVYSAGLIVLTALAEHTGSGIAFAVAGAFSVFGALCYLPAWRAERTTGRA
jgi:predicted MFS family arabinose efflux permease